LSTPHPNGFKPVGGHAYKNVTNGLIHDPLLPPPSPPPSRPPTTIINSKNGHVLYKDVYFKNTANGTYKRKKSPHTLWNPQWDDDKILEEMSYAWAGKKFEKTVKATHYYEAFLSDGTLVEIRVDNSRVFLGNTYFNHLALFTLQL
jgi:hypothetical protein